MMVILHEDGYMTDLDNIRVRIQQDVEDCKEVIKTQNIDQKTMEMLVNNIYACREELCEINDILNSRFNFIVVIEG